MKRNTLVITAIFLLVFMLLTIVGSAFYSVAFAQTAEEEVEQARQEQEETQKKIDENKEQQGNMLEYKGQLDENINALHLQLESLDETIHGVHITWDLTSTGYYQVDSGGLLVPIEGETPSCAMTFTMEKVS